MKLPPQQAAPFEKTLKYKEAEEHFLRRLGSAVILHWDELSNDMQDLLIDQASIVLDRDEAPHASTDIENFVRNVKAVSSQKKEPKV
jgi:hypothetical protein